VLQTVVVTLENELRKYIRNSILALVAMLYATTICLHAWQ